MTSSPLYLLQQCDAPPAGGWAASLQMQLARRGERTALVGVKHAGPLRLQRPFYPEGPAHPHIYLLHPPGGMVPGDQLDITVDVCEGATALVTTPASGKVYDVGERRLPQLQRVTANVAPGAVLEWLPQDTLFFNGARYEGDITIHLTGDARVMLWDVATLGRRAGDFPFLDGGVSQRLALYRDGLPLLLERFAVQAGDPMLNEPWGLGGARTWGVAVATLAVDKILLDNLRALAESYHPDRASVTAMKQVVIARFIGHCPARALQYFQHFWRLVRPALLGREACAPRVWAT